MDNSHVSKADTLLAIAHNEPDADLVISLLRERHGVQGEKRPVLTHSIGIFIDAQSVNVDRPNKLPARLYSLVNYSQGVVDCIERTNGRQLTTKGP